MQMDMFNKEVEAFMNPCRKILGKEPIIDDDRRERFILDNPVPPLHKMNWVKAKHTPSPPNALIKWWNVNCVKYNWDCCRM